MWKQQCFQVVSNRLRPKLDSTSAENVIGVFAEHFSLSTSTAEETARNVLSRFEQAFKDVRYLKPTGFLNRDGVNVTSKLLDDPRPAHICHLGITACINMQHLSAAFNTKLKIIKRSFYISLPQSNRPGAYDLYR